MEFHVGGQDAAHFASSLGGDEGTGNMEVQRINVTERQRDLLCHLSNISANNYRWSPAPPRDASCAVVSSSGALLAHEHGADIDAHDIIIRMNTAPTDGFERYVGHHDGRHRALSISYGRVNWTESVTDKALIVGSDQLMKLTQQHGKKLNFLVSRWYKTQKNVHQFLKDAYHEYIDATTGVNAMMFALTNCARVDAYEMIPSQIAERMPYHYFRGSGRGGDGGSARRDSFSNEQDLWKELTTTPQDVWWQTGKTSYAGFTSVDCSAASAMQSASPLSFVQKRSNTSDRG
eukprot:gnl/TRDRNA2_/TRDRNA2_160334_c2_seq1.p1 gnl/TRDRNA2_/TRDRNA2_160334_c2~~gnl/TRDRNA2_/TRDRNA2_160334_c2_seq1.p1  ORF type:complete len:290 (+),score=37.41 gnl/TRDRNA2_/TRDRNA2_160334_c2_seq1:222-1091(+)